MALIMDAILSLDAKAKVKVVSEDYDKITWFDDNPNKITVDQIKNKAELDKVDKANEYKMQNKKEYPRIEEQLCHLHKGIDNGSNKNS